MKRWLWQAYYANAGSIIDILLASIVINTFVLALPIFLMNVYDRVVPNLAYETLWVMVSGVLLVIFFELILKLVRHEFLDRVGERMDVAVSSAIHKHLLAAKLDHSQLERGAFVNAFQQFEYIRGFVSASVLIALLDIPFGLIFLVFIWLLGGSQMVFVPLIGIGLVVGLAILRQFKLRFLTSKYQSAVAANNTTLIETTHQLDDVKALGIESERQRLWTEGVSRSSNLSLSLRKQTFQLQSVAATISQLCMVFVVVQGVYLFAEQEISLGALIACVLLLNRALAPFVSLSALFSQYHQAKSAVDSVDSILSLPEEPISKSTELDSNGLNSFDIVLKGLSYRYPNAKNDALVDVDLKISEGEKVGLIGTVGSGKSTLLNVLAGQFQDYRGDLLLGGVNCEAMGGAAYRRQNGYQPQRVSLFRGTIEYNVKLNRDDVDAQSYEQALEVSGLASFAASLPGGLGCQIGDDSIGLSGGQRQSVGLARAIATSPKIIILDEPGQGLDNQSESRLRSNLADFVATKTLILSTHKASMLSLVDRIIVLENGRVLADGNKQDILEGLKSGKIKLGSDS